MTYPLRTSLDAIKKIRNCRRALDDLDAGLNGKPFVWDVIEAKFKQFNLQQMGFQVCTASEIEAKGLKLKADVSPVGSRYYGPPMNREAELYLLEIHATTKGKQS
jgi:hypothetical protein